MKVFDSLVSGAAGVAKAIDDNKATQSQLEELKRHNRVMKGHGVYLAPYKRGGITMEKIKKIKNVKQLLKMPKGVTINVQLQQLAKRMHIPYFRDIFMRTTLSIEGVYRNESNIVHWIMLMDQVIIE